MSKEILKGIINEFSAEKFIQFFRVKNSKLNYPNAPLNYDGNNPETSSGQVFGLDPVRDTFFKVFPKYRTKNLSNGVDNEKCGVIYWYEKKIAQLRENNKSIRQNKGRKLC